MDIAQNQMLDAVKVQHDKRDISGSITFIRFMVCLVLLFTIIFAKNNNTALYEYIKNIYINGNSIEVLDKSTIIYYISSFGSTAFGFLKTCTLTILRSVTS